MFTGIIETTGVVTATATSGTNKSFWISSAISGQLKVDQSVAHNGVCLTVEEIAADKHRVTAIAETLEKTNLGFWQPGYTVNLERCLELNGRLDGHFVQGHADTTAFLLSKKDMSGSWLLRFQFPVAFAALVIEKGSVTVNGISLTAFDVTKDCFSVAIIPYTWQHTNLQFLETGHSVNIEFDMIGKYLQRFATVNNTA
ncbi:MAG: riboflavin synthase [Flavihumibacter sp.]|nr:riboflavin synthase [Flavihumibacter sp.]